MTSTTQSGPPRGVLWGFRAVVLGSLVVAGWHIYPIWRESSMEHAVLLAADEHRNYALEGARRLRRQASHSESRRHGLLKRGAITTLTRAAAHPDASVRDAALHALSIFAVAAARDHVHKETPARQLLRFRSIADALVAADCGAGCLALWNTIVASERSQSRHQRIEQLRSLVSNHNSLDFPLHHSDQQRRQQQHLPQ